MTGSDVGCYGKKHFPSYWAANRAAKQLNRFVQTAKANAYHCTLCRGYHVGNTMGERSHKRVSRHQMKELLNHGRVEFSE